MNAQPSDLSVDMLKAISAGWFYVPFNQIGGPDRLAAEKGMLTFKPKFAEDDDPPLRLYRELTSRGFLGVPRAYGMARFPWLGITDNRSYGEEIAMPPRLPDPNHPRVKEPEKQAAFMQDLLQGLQVHQNFTAMASTGSGKTVCALWAASQLRRKTLILVHLERLMEQWLEEIRDKLGLPESRIGKVQSDVCQYHGRDFVVGMMPSISMRRDYPEDFYRSFGTVIVDECHRVGSPLLSQCVPLFPAVYRLGLSATPKRKDGADRVGFWHIGPIMVTSKAKALECTVYVKRFRSRTPLWGNNAIVRAKCLSQDKQRNLELVSLIQRTYRAGRNILVIGKFVDHLQNLMELCVQYGIPHSDMGQYTGQRFIRQKVLTPEGMKVKTVRKVNISNREYARVKAESRIIFATYGVFREGIDVPRLDCGIDVLPQSDAEQVIGRIRRPMEGKPSPYWITLVDENCVFSQQMFTNRLKDYAKTGCRVVESPSI